MYVTVLTSITIRSINMSSFLSLSTRPLLATVKTADTAKEVQDCETCPTTQQTNEKRISDVRRQEKDS